MNILKTVSDTSENFKIPTKILPNMGEKSETLEWSRVKTGKKYNIIICPYHVNVGLGLPEISASRTIFSFSMTSIFSSFLTILGDSLFSVKEKIFFFIYENYLFNLD